MGTVSKAPDAGQLTARARARRAVAQLSEAERRGLARGVFALAAYMASFERHGKHDARTEEARQAWLRERAATVNADGGR